MVDTHTVPRCPLDGLLLGEELHQLVAEHQVPGAQLAVHQRGETVAVEVGELTHGTGRRVTPDAVFPVGSITKTCTATVLSILAADGDLDLAAPVEEYLPEVAELDAHITVGRLLSHTSGLAGEPGLDEPAVSLRRYVVEQAQPRNMLQPPGVGFSYSNLGYALAGRVIESLTGMSWPDATASILLRPLGIEPVFLADRRPARPVATGHSVNLAVGRTRSVEQSPLPAAAPAGALALSAADLITLAQLHLPPGVSDLLPAADAARMRQPDPAARPFGVADGWALGLAVYRTGTTVWYGHDGNATGTACYFRVNPSSGEAIAFTSNSNTGYGLWLDLVDRLSGWFDVPIGRYRVSFRSRPIPAPAACLGVYVNGDTEYLVTSAEDGLLQLTVDGDIFPGIVCHEDLTLAVPDPTSVHQSLPARFVRDRLTGQVDGIQFGGRLARRRILPVQQKAGRLTA